MAYGKKPTTCAHQVVLGLCVMSCLAFGAWPRPVESLHEEQVTLFAQRMALGLTLQMPGIRVAAEPDPTLQLTTAASTRGSWPRRTLLSPNN
jgi:hypothetical protein